MYRPHSILVTINYKKNKNKINYTHRPHSIPVTINYTIITNIIKYTCVCGSSSSSSSSSCASSDSAYMRSRCRVYTPTATMFARVSMLARLIYVCMYVYTYVCMYVCMYVLCMYTYTHTYIHTHVCMYIRMYVYTYVCMWKSIYDAYVCIICLLTSSPGSGMGTTDDVDFRCWTASLRRQFGVRW